MLKRYAGYRLLVIDEVGYVPFSEEGAAPVFQVLAERHEQKSVIIPSHMEFGNWTQIFGAPNLTAASLDRIPPKAHIVSCNWESYRLKEMLKNGK